MELNKFDEFILKIPSTATNAFNQKEKENLSAWFAILTIVNFVCPVIGLIIALIMQYKDKDSALIGYLTSQALWMCLLVFVNLVPVLGLLAWLCLGVIVIYGNFAGKYFELPFVGKYKLQVLIS